MAYQRAHAMSDKCQSLLVNPFFFTDDADSRLQWLQLTREVPDVVVRCTVISLGSDRHLYNRFMRKSFCSNGKGPEI